MAELTELEKLKKINEELDIFNAKLAHQNDRLEHQINILTLHKINENLKNLGGNK